MRIIIRILHVKLSKIDDLQYPNNSQAVIFFRLRLSFFSVNTTINYANYNTIANVIMINNFFVWRIGLFARP